MGFGGPVWHASVAPRPGLRLPERELKRLAYRHLAGVGDMGREWVEYSGYAFHLRRRLTAEEQAAVGEAIDLRGTPEAVGRHRAAVSARLPGPAIYLGAKEIGV